MSSIAYMLAPAFHEAGHAVIGTRLRLGFQWCTIDPRRLLARHQAGVTCCEMNGPAGDVIVYLLAGFFAERKAGFSDWPSAFCGSANDFRTAQQLHPQPSAPLDELVARAEAMVEAEWKGIQAVAAVLLTDEYLDRDQVIAILETGSCQYRQPPVQSPTLGPAYEWQVVTELNAISQRQEKDLVEEAIRLRGWPHPDARQITA